MGHIICILDTSVVCRSHQWYVGHINDMLVMSMVHNVNGMSGTLYICWSRQLVWWSIQWWMCHVYGV
jgi:hypothetical protein